MSDPLRELGEARYALLTTYRRDGRAVPTPVWIVGLDGGLGVWTVADSGKVKRIRRNPKVTLATCDVRGRHAGPAHAGRAYLREGAAADPIKAGIADKYGIMGRLTLLGSRMRRGRTGTIGVMIELTSPPA